MRHEPENSFFEIYDRHYSSVRNFIRAVVKDDFTADDLTQETFVRAHKSIGTFKENSSMAPWLMQIAYNLCRDHFRKAKKSPIDAKPLKDDVVLCGTSMTEKALERRQMSTCVQNQILLLPEAQRTVLFLYDGLGFVQKEIAEILDISVENVKVRLYRARKRLKSILQQNCTFERDERNVFVCLPRNQTPGADSADSGH
jgi:RNA polymerase sigma-70 factor (ECF subfamily)